MDSIRSKFRSVSLLGALIFSASLFHFLPHFYISQNKPQHTDNMEIIKELRKINQGVRREDIENKISSSSDNEK